MYLAQLIREVILQGLIYWFLVMGLWISFRLFRYPDLALEMYVVSGGMIGLLGLNSGAVGIFGAVVCALLVSLLLGTCACFLWKWGRIQAVIVSLILSYLIYSLLLYAFGPLINGEGIFRVERNWNSILFLGMVLGGLVAAFRLLLKTKLGSEVVAVASNPTMAKKIGLPVRRIQVLALSTAFFLGHFSGLLHGAYFGYTNISDGVGFLMVAIFCVFTTHAIYRRINPVINGILLFATLQVFFISINGAIELGLDPSLTKAGIAVLLIFVLLTLRKFNRDGVLQIG